jgi:hypothetical protein
LYLGRDGDVEISVASDICAFLGALIAS